MARTRLIQAIHDAVVEEMERDPKVIVYGEDVDPDRMIELLDQVSNHIKAALPESRVAHIDPGHR